MSEQQNGEPRTVNVWHVERIEDTSSFTPGKGAVRVKRIYYALYDGTESYADFPASTFDLTKAEAEIDRQAQLLYKATQLKGPEIVVGGS